MGTQVYNYANTDTLKVDEGNKIKYAGGGLSETIDHTQKALNATKKRLDALIESSAAVPIGGVMGADVGQFGVGAMGEQRRLEVLQRLGETRAKRGVFSQLPSLKPYSRGHRLHQSNLNNHARNMLRDSANSFNSLNPANHYPLSEHHNLNHQKSRYPRDKQSREQKTVFDENFDSFAESGEETVNK